MRPSAWACQNLGSSGISGIGVSLKGRTVPETTAELFAGTDLVGESMPMKNCSPTSLFVAPFRQRFQCRVSDIRGPISFFPIPKFPDDPKFAMVPPSTPRSTARGRRDGRHYPHAMALPRARPCRRAVRSSRSTVAAASVVAWPPAPPARARARRSLPRASRDRRHSSPGAPARQ